VRPAPSLDGGKETVPLPERVTRAASGALEEPSETDPCCLRTVRGDLRNNRKPQPAKTVLPNKHSMNTLIVFLATFNVLIWGHNAVMIAGIIASMLVNAFSS
jgi:hypothetical protein